MVLSIGSLPEDGVVVELLKEFKSHILGNGHEGSKKGSKKIPDLSGAGNKETLLALASALFGRAPEDFLKRTSLEEMHAIAAECLSAYEVFLQTSKPYVVSCGISKNVPYIISVMQDRAFVVDTTTELLKKFSLDYSVVLHPIIISQDQTKVSLVYVQLDGTYETEIVARFSAALSLAFNDLLLATDHFPAILEQVNETTRSLRDSLSFCDQPEEVREVIDFLNWLSDGGFVFLGYREWAENGDFHVVKDKDLGLFHSTTAEIFEGLEDAIRNAKFLRENPKPFLFSKAPIISPVHRHQLMDLVTVRLPSTTNGNTTGNTKSYTKYICFLGMLTSKSIAQESSTVPIIRQKVRSVIALEGLLPNSHDYKEVISIIDVMPKADLLQYPLEKLRQEISTVFHLQRRDESKLTYFLDDLKRFYFFKIIVPRDRYSKEVRHKIQLIIEKAVGAPQRSSEYHIGVSDYPLVVIRLLVPYSSEQAAFDISELSNLITEAVLTWDDLLQKELVAANGENTGYDLYTKYFPLFSSEYKASSTPIEAVRDITQLELLSAENALSISMIKSDTSSDSYRLSIYKLGESLTLSEILPYLENCGFNTISETVFALARNNVAWAGIYDLHLTTKNGRTLQVDVFTKRLLPNLKLVLTGVSENDRLNHLLLEPGLECKQIALLRTVRQYMVQIKVPSSVPAINDALINNPTIVSCIFEYFDSKFNPKLSFNAKNTRASLIEQKKQTFVLALKNVPSVVHDRALRSVFNVLEAAVRTNYYQADKGFRIALKIQCSQISIMPNPRPLFEIFITAPEFEGVHLRGGKVARGGIRWSDRLEDFRTEVHGLMRTQMVKNTIIIPVGAKGGFVLKKIPVGTDLQYQVRYCYEKYIRSLLEITDNRNGHEITSPPDCIVHDEQDPYLVVAADRGTASFSDLANSIAVKDFSFWLGDAFASGGSVGYDHKKFGITAKGAWEAVKVHFREMGIDPESAVLTVTGIGDMSGDVFGNGLLLSPNFKLLAAFNHKHIFLDPDPDPSKSFKERARLFEKQQSQWSDYDPKLISSGGGVFERSLKEITLSPEVKKALSTSLTTVSGEELIRLILTAPVDLLWNGGIGTYIKSFSEDNAYVGDRTNDDVRVDARDLKARVIAEGGNLGMTQLGRIEYSRIGGHVNTDAVDNSGGVGMSDIEVNFKILLAQTTSRGDISIADRNELLKQCSDDACKKVVTRNRLQSLCLSIGIKSSRRYLSNYQALIHALEKQKLFDRGREFLPDDQTLEKRASLKAGLTRPELALLMAYSKMSIYDTVIKSSIADDLLLEKCLFEYFPKTITERYSKDVITHPLRREIIATSVANVIVERMGSAFVNKLSQESNASAAHAVNCYLTADIVLNASELISQLAILETPTSMRTYFTCLFKLQTALEETSRWFVEHSLEQSSLSTLVEPYLEKLKNILAITPTLVSAIEKNRFEQEVKALTDAGVDIALAEKISSLTYAGAYLDIIKIADERSIDSIEVAKLYSEVALVLQIRFVLEQAATIETNDQWEAVAIRSLISQVRSSMSRLTKEILRTRKAVSSVAINQYFEEHRLLLDRYQATLHEFRSKQITMSALFVIANQLSAMGD